MWVQDNYEASGMRWVDDTQPTSTFGTGSDVLGQTPQLAISMLQTAFKEAGMEDYGGAKVTQLAQQLGPNATIDQINAVIQQQGLRPFSGMQDLQARNAALPGHNVSLSPFNPIDVVKGVGETASDLWSEPGFRALALTAGAGSLMGGPSASLGTGAPVGIAEEAAMLGVGAPGAAGGIGTSVAGGTAAGAATAGGGGALVAGAGGPPVTPPPAAVGGGLATALGVSPDTLRLLGIAGATGLGMYGANQQADALRGIAEQGRADRAPFLNKSLEYLNSPEAYYSGPGQASLNGVLRALSVKGNPFGSPTSLAIATEAGMRDWRDAVTGFGNMGLSGEDARMNLQGQATGADANVLNALGYGIGQATNPPTSLEQLLRGMRGGSLSLV
jgi:hypothetical protein